jgi:hypothetical protein
MSNTTRLRVISKRKYLLRCGCLQTVITAANSSMTTTYNFKIDKSKELKCAL